MTYHFTQQHDRGQQAERLIYLLFQERFNVIPAGREDQRRGIDFRFHDRELGTTFTVELKTDWRTVSIVPIHTPNPLPPTPGWAYTSEAEWLLYFLPNAMPQKIYRVGMASLRAELIIWNDTCPTRQIPNKGRDEWVTEGLLVPLSEFDRLAIELIEIE